ncbi:hypothetical protein OESDEN_08251 [Oesophagostomum dentatum]|uniref:Uncharacterized protein n=2 Tax=Oesophagostomum dentatum TaxID=61180 RepID=A0A0B1T916_OESDE|nr:hypothetical protein OESDEN_08251 [Oesophagostomum dentatum]
MAMRRDFELKFDNHEYLGYKMRRDFELKFDNHEYLGYVIILDGCVWFWVGEKNVTSLGLALFPMSSMLIDTPNTQNVCVKAITMRIAKIFQGRQVFFSSDIDEEDPLFWQHLFVAMQPEFDRISAEIST